jgi:microcystin-dependent protein
MSDPFIGEIRMFGGNFAPVGWAFCAGQIMSIAENDALFTLIGTTYGGDGETTFALPNLQSRLPIHNGGGFTLGASGGVEEVTLTVQQIPAHSHPMLATNDVPTLSNPGNNVPGQAAAKFYRAGNPTVQLNPQAISSTGGSQPHTNIQPYLCVSFIISLFGIFPSQA